MSELIIQPNTRLISDIFVLHMLIERSHAVIKRSHVLTKSSEACFRKQERYLRLASGQKF